VKLEGGIGLSLINKVPEELVFASLTGINVHYTQLATSHMLELSIQDVQVSGGGSELVGFFFFLPAEQLTRSVFNVLGTLVLWCTFLVSFKKLSYEKKHFYLHLSLLIFPDSRILNYSS